MRKRGEEEQKHHEHLEELIEERTAEPVNANQEFEQEVIEGIRAGEAQRGNEEKFRMLFEKSNDAIFLVDRFTGRYLDANKAAEELTGRSLADLKRLTIFDVIPERARERLEKLSDVVKTDELEEVTYVRTDGAMRIALLNTIPLNNGMVFEIVRDITDQKQEEKALKEHEEQYHNNPIETITVDTEARITGYTLARTRYSVELPSIGDVIYKDYAIEHDIDMHNELMECIKSRKSKTFREQKYKDKYLDIHMSPFPGGAIITTIDIIDRKLAEEALSTLNAISQTVNQSLDLEKILNDILEKVIELFGLHSSHIRLIDENTQELVISAHKGYTSEDLKELTIRKKPGEGSAAIPIQSGEVVVVEDYLADPRFVNRQGFIKRIGCRSFVIIPLRSKNNIIGTMSINSREPRSYTDKEIQLFHSIGHQVGIAIENARLYQDKETTIRELNKMQEILQQAQKMEAIGTIAGGIAHDFNNLLSPIMIHSELAMTELAPHDPIQHNLKEIFKAGERARDLVKQILTFSRKEEGKRAVIRITPILRESLKLLRSTIPTTIDIHRHLEAESDTVLADPTRIHQIMLNLGTNAAHAMREKGGTLEVSLVQWDLTSEDAAQYSDLSPGPYLRLTVSDTGSGMDDGTIQKIFEPYFTTKAPSEGTGMGLSVVLGIVKSYGGDITVESEPEKGATFNVVLPRIEEDVPPVEERKIVLPRGTERVLFVDDEKGAVDAVQLMLENLGYIVTTRTSSIEALEVFRNNPERFDLVIMDTTMPNMTGVDLAKELILIRPGIPIILCTGFSEQIDEKKSRLLGIRSFVMKPIVMREMANTLRQVLDKERR